MTHLGPLAPATLCRTCRRPLDSVEKYSGETLVGWEYVHTLLDVQRGQADHAPDPILRDDAAGSAVTVCDFCSAPGPRWTYGCLPFNYNGIPAGSDGDWGACDSCRELIDADRWGDLADRSIESMLFHSKGAANRQQKEFMRRQVLAMHQQFATHRTGPATAERPPARRAP